MVALKLVLFDCDGTLVDSQDSIVQAMFETWRRHNLAPPSAAQVRAVVGLSLLEAITAIKPKQARVAAETLVTTYRQVFSEMRAADQVHEPLFPGIAATLHQLESKGYVLGIATGKSRRGLLASLDAHNLTERFVSQQTGDDGPGKPNPRMVHQAMDELGCTPERTVMIGDTSYDMQMAKNAGVVGIGVTWGYHSQEQLLQGGANQLVSKPEQLLQTITELM